MHVHSASAAAVRVSLLTVAVGALFLPRAQAQREVGRVSAADFGQPRPIGTIDLSDDGNRAIFAASGSPYEAYVMERTTHGWERAAILPAGWSVFYETSIAIGDDVAVVGAPEDDSAAGWLSGSAFVYERGPSGWTRTQELAPHDAASEDGFGSSLALDGDTLVVAASHALVRYGDGAAAAYVFERGAGGWVETQKLVPSSTDWTFGSFGFATALQGDTLVLGSRGSSDAGTLSGSAFVFERGPSGWTEVAQLVASDAEPGTRFGNTVAVDGNRLLVGAAGSSPAVYVFERSGGAWVETAKLQPSVTSHVSSWGSALALQGDRALIGARNDGAAHLYTHVAGSWKRAHLFVSPDGLVGFGRGVALVDGTAAIVAPGPNYLGLGTAYVFDLL